MDQPRVVPYRPERLPEVIALWEASRPPEGLARRRKIFRWYTERNPGLRGRPAYWCLEENGALIGMHGHMPVVFDVDGVERLGHMAQDDLLHPSCRGRGLGQVLLAGATAGAPDFSAAMWFNDANHRSYAKAGWIDVPGFRRWVRFLDAGRLAAEMDRPPLALAARWLGRLALRAIDLPARARRRRDLVIAAVDAFDARFDALWERTKGGLGIAVRRDAAYLAWRWTEKPYTRYRRVAVSDPGGELRGYLVWRPVPEDGGLVGRVFDVLDDPACPGALDALLLHAVDAAREAGCTHVVCAAALPRLVAALRRLGFLPNRRTEHHMVTNWESAFAREHVTDIRRWHLTLGDADGDVWTEQEPEGAA